LSNEIEEYLIVGEEIDTTITLYRTYLSYINNSEYIVPSKIIKKAEKIFINDNKDNNKYDINKTDRTESNDTLIISDIKKENKKNIFSDDHIKIKKVLIKSNNAGNHNIIASKTVDELIKVLKQTHQLNRDEDIDISEDLSDK
jgi:hypothetical protein